MTQTHRIAVDGKYSSKVIRITRITGSGYARYRVNSICGDSEPCTCFTWRTGPYLVGIFWIAHIAKKSADKTEDSNRFFFFCFGALLTLAVFYILYLFSK